MIAIRTIALCSLAVVLMACQTQVKRDNAAESQIDAWAANVSDAKDVRPQAPKGPVIVPRDDGPAWDWSDPCVENLHELTGVLLLYYQTHHELPETLEQLSLKGLEGEAVSLKCPASGKEYVYNREGLVPPLDIVPDVQKARGGNRLIVYDAEPAHEITQHLTDGQKNWDVKKMARYGIVMEPPSLDGSVRLSVVVVEQALLDAYLRETAAERRGGGQNVPREITPSKKPQNSLW